MEDLIIKHTTKCECGHQFIIQDINGLKRVNDIKFYGGVVKHYSETNCPECGKPTIMLLKQAGQTYKVLDIAENAQVAARNTQVTTENAQVIAQEEITNENICPICNKEFKTSAGLKLHSKVHNK